MLPAPWADRWRRPAAPHRATVAAFAATSPPASATTPATPADRSPSSDSHDHETNVTRLRRYAVTRTPVHRTFCTRHVDASQVRVKPDGEWAQRIALEKIDSAPPESRQSKPPLPGHRRVRVCGLLATAAGFALYFVLF